MRRCAATVNKRAVGALAVALLSACGSHKNGATSAASSPRTTTTSRATAGVLGPNDIRIESIGTPASDTQTVVITGLFADAGTFSFNGKTSSLTLSKGTIEVDAGAGGRAETALFADITKILNPKTCGLYGAYTAPAVLENGTGKYAGIHGTLTVTTTEYGVLPVLPDGTCNQDDNASPVGFLSVAEGTGAVSFS